LQEQRNNGFFYTPPYINLTMQQQPAWQIYPSLIVFDLGLYIRCGCM